MNMRIYSALILSLIFKLFLTGQPAIAQTGNRQIQGVVLSGDQLMPIKGVEIALQGGGVYYSDSTGAFSFPAEGSDLWLTFNYPGYNQKEMFWSGQDLGSVIISRTSQRSPDSYMPGFFGNTEKYRNASFDYITESQLYSTNYVTPGLLMQGRLAGVNSTAFSGMPGEGANLNIRGISSLFASKAPLVLVDGMPYNSRVAMNEVTAGNIHNPLKGIDVKDIQKIEVIRDGGALYGLQGANGLIVITTRQPESVTTRVNVSANAGVTFQPENIEVLNTSQYKTYLVNQLQNSGTNFSKVLQENPWISGNPSYIYYYNYNNETDWQDEIFRAARFSKLNIDLQGGDEIARFAVMLGYLNQQGVVESTNYQRFNFRLNSDIRVIEKLFMISNVGFSYHVSDLNNFGIDQSLNPVSAALVKGPMFGSHLRDNDGNIISVYSNSDEYGFSNPSVIINRSLSSSFESNFFTNLKLQYEPAVNVRLKNTVSIAFNNIKDNSFIPDYGITDLNSGELYNSAVEGIYKNYTVINETSAEWLHNLNLDHFFEHRAGLRITTNNEISNTGKVYNTPTDEFRSLSSVALVENTYLSGFASNTDYSDLFVYNRYRFRDKYLADLVLTLSASSNTGSKADAFDLMGGKWGFFPSLNLGWLISNESFMQSANRVDLLKLRAGFSKTGNDFNRQEKKYFYSSRTYGLNSGLVRTYIPNENLKWEDITQMNLGVDLYVLNEGLRFSLDVYNRKTSDLLVYKEMPRETGFEVLWENNGSLTTRGMDLSTEVKILRGEFRLSLGGNLSLNRSVVELENDLVLNVPGGNVIIKDGESPFSFFGLETNGIYHTVDEALQEGFRGPGGNPYTGGDVRFTDQDGNKIINMGDRVIIGDLIPDLQAGVFISLNFRSLSLFALGEYSSGNQIFNYTRMILESMSGYENQSIAAFYAWKNDGDQTDIPRIAYGDPSGNAAFSDRWLEEGRFFRIREVTLSYTLPPTSFYDNVKVYLTAQNLLTSSGYLGYYPEFSYSPNPAYQSIDYGQVPVTPSLMLGINIGF
jgi:TonB-linked SusC/RagA family outer membrane protein